MSQFRRCWIPAWILLLLTSKNSRWFRKNVIITRSNWKYWYLLAKTNNVFFFLGVWGFRWSHWKCTRCMNGGFVIHIRSSARYSTLTDKFAYFKYYLGCSIVYERPKARSSVADPWHFSVDSDLGSADPCIWPIDPYPDPAIFVIDLQQDANKKTNLKFFCWLVFEGIFTSFFNDKESKRSHKAVGIKVFLTIFLGDRRIRIHTSD